MAQELALGTLLYHNQYRIEMILGQGGFGITYLAHDSLLDRKVAIKEFFPKEFCSRAGDTTIMTSGSSGHSNYVKKLKDKFMNEARHIGRLNHPNIIKIYTAFEENDTAYYVMEYIEGENLSEKVKRSGPLKEKVAINYIKKVGDALEYMHKRKFNHLDVKPANIMIESSSNTPILIDFGLSTHYDAGEELPTGTMPPGISNGYSPIELYDYNREKTFNPRHDVYSLAATLYFLVSGITPPSAVQLSSSSLTFQSNFPESLKEPVKTAMAVSLEGRYLSIKDFINKISPKNYLEDNFAANTITRQIVGNTDEDGTYLELNGKKIRILLLSSFLINNKWLSVFSYLSFIFICRGILDFVGLSSGENPPSSHQLLESLFFILGVGWFLALYDLTSLKKSGYIFGQIILFLSFILNTYGFGRLFYDFHFDSRSIGYILLSAFVYLLSVFIIILPIICLIIMKKKWISNKKYYCKGCDPTKYFILLFLYVCYCLDVYLPLN